MESRHTFVEDLSEILERHKVLKVDELLAMQKAFKNSEKEQFDDFLLEEGFVSRDDLLKALSEYYQVPAFDVIGYFFNHDLVTKFSKGFLLREGVVPVEVDNNILSVVASEPDKDGLESRMREFVSYDIVFMVGLRIDIGDAVKEFYDKSPADVGVDEDLREERALESEAEAIESTGESILKEED